MVEDLQVEDLQCRLMFTHGTTEDMSSDIHMEQLLFCCFGDGAWGRCMAISAHLANHSLCTLSQFSHASPESKNQTEVPGCRAIFYPPPHKPPISHTWRVRGI